MAMLVSVIIPVYHDWERLDICVKALEDQKIEDFDVEVIIINNDPSDSKPDFLQLKENFHLISEERPGSYVARNRGIQEARGDIIAFTDADCIPDQYWLANGVDMIRNNDADLVAGRIELFKNPGGSDTVHHYEKHTIFNQKEDVKIDNAVTANLLVRREVIAEAGPFDEVMKSGGDWEFSQRAVSCGFKMAYSHDSLVYHPSRFSLKELLKKQCRLISWGYLNTKEKFGHGDLRIFGSMLYGKLSLLFQRPKKVDRNSIFHVLFVDILMIWYTLLLYFKIIFRVIKPEDIRE